MASRADEGEAQAVCQVEGCDDPPGYTMMFDTGWVDLCAADYREVVLDLKKVQLKSRWSGPIRLEGVKKL